MSIIDKVIAELPFLDAANPAHVLRAESAVSDAFLLLYKAVSASPTADPETLSEEIKMLIRLRSCLLLLEQEAVVAVSADTGTPSGVYLKKIKADVVEKEFAAFPVGQGTSSSDLRTMYQKKLCSAAAAFGYYLPECASASSGSNGQGTDATDFYITTYYFTQ